MHLKKTFKNEVVFGRSEVEKVLNLKSTRCSYILKEMLEKGIIEKVFGQGKGKYRFKKKETFIIDFKVINNDF